MQKNKKRFGVNMDFFETTLKNAYVISPKLRSDERGGFARIFCKQEFEAIGHTKDFVQFNHSFNPKRGTLRGMHYQEVPYAEIKLIRCILGKVYDVIVDLREESPTFLHSFGVVLSAENMKMMYVPERFAHGFITLADDCELLYHHTAYYEPSAERGLRYDDPTLNIEWPEVPTVVSTKDQNYSLLDKNFLGLNKA
jgi:dTDP-4-dehydrorhamnose 3,5-epimerase